MIRLGDMAWLEGFCFRPPGGDWQYALYRSGHGSWVAR